MVTRLIPALLAICEATAVPSLVQAKNTLDSFGVSPRLVRISLSCWLML